MPEIAVMLTPREIRGLRMALIWGVPDEVPAEIQSATAKLNEAEQAADRLGMGDGASDETLKPTEEDRT